MFWGMSPALDLQEEYLNAKPCDLQVFNVLLIGGCDARHILKTMAQSYRHKKILINFHVVEGRIELIARQLLLLFTALQDSNGLGLSEKTTMFMEVFGNVLLRSTTSRFLMSASNTLKKMITDLNYMRLILPMLRCESLKYRDRDQIEVLFKFWENGSGADFDVCRLWDERIRRSLGTRYDSRVGVFDWDHNMRFKDLGTTVGSQEYKHFRGTGVAFTWLEREVSRPNCSLSAGVEAQGTLMSHRGYVGDIVTGPYIAYSLDCEDKAMLKSTNGTRLKRATDIAERNIMRIMYELEHEKNFDATNFTGDLEVNLGAVTLAEIDAKIAREEDLNPPKNNQYSFSYIKNDSINIYFHSLSALGVFPSKSEFRGAFNLMYVAHNLVPTLQPPLLSVMEEGGVVLVEAPKYVIDLKKKDVESFGEMVRKAADSCGCKVVEQFDPFKDSYAKLIVEERVALQ